MCLSQSEFPYKNVLVLLSGACNCPIFCSPPPAHLTLSFTSCQLLRLHFIHHSNLLTTFLHHTGLNQDLQLQLVSSDLHLRWLDDAFTSSCHSFTAVQTWPFLPFSSAVSPHSPTHPLPRPIALCSNVSPAPSLQQRGPDQTTVAWVVSADLQGNRSACHCHHCVPKMSLIL